MRGRKPKSSNAFSRPPVRPVRRRVDEGESRQITLESVSVSGLPNTGSVPPDFQGIEPGLELLSVRSRNQALRPCFSRPSLFSPPVPSDRPAGFAAGPGRSRQPRRRLGPISGTYPRRGRRALKSSTDRGTSLIHHADWGGVGEVEPPPVDPMDPDPPGRAAGRPGPGPDGHASATGDAGPEPPLLPATGSEKKTMTACAVPIARRLDRRR